MFGPDFSHSLPYRSLPAPYDVLYSVGDANAGCVSGAVIAGRSVVRRRGIPGVPKPRKCDEWDHAALLRSHAIVQWWLRECWWNPRPNGSSGRDQQ